MRASKAPASGTEDEMAPYGGVSGWKANQPNQKERWDGNLDHVVRDSLSLEHLDRVCLVNSTRAEPAGRPTPGSYLAGFGDRARLHSDCGGGPQGEAAVGNRDLHSIRKGARLIPGRE